MHILADDVQWPANSPDLSVIEICWALMKQKMDLSSATTEDEIFAEACRAWNLISLDTINRLINSFDNRLECCVLSNGESINQHHRLFKAISSSADAAQKYQEEQNALRTAIAHFVACSATLWQYFPRMSRDLAYLDSLAICRCLPDPVKRRTGLPHRV